MRDESQPAHRRDQMAIATLQYTSPKLSAMAISNDKPSSAPYVEIINIVSVPSGRHFTAEEAAVPVVREIPGAVTVDAVALPAPCERQADVDSSS
jgi:hypothetical protein